ncbi:hypothetical protein AZ78_0210 [Lysobacter capsici AZ78]|uniref:Uncharacterized protein n=1 Tax=Lysobacter capsici AZ78 TaxID=1444315 RepID=A0A108U518_9GAMM|nr:hypothetical protein AZ78_0210 [Lysobacter capsici AZ78]
MHAAPGRIGTHAVRSCKTGSKRPYGCYGPLIKGGCLARTAPACPTRGAWRRKTEGGCGRGPVLCSDALRTGAPMMCGEVRVRTWRRCGVPVATGLAASGLTAIEV